tara:strand:+ start:49 stop:1317 length:1269 start_codon:yes stop_codon:yes gene_type:complete
MFSKIKKVSKNTNLTQKIILILFAAFPISFILGNLIINVFILSIGLLFAFYVIKNKKYEELDHKIFYLLCFFLISLLINLIFSNNIELSSPRVLKFIFIIFFIFAFKNLIKINSYYFENIILKIWLLVLFVVIVDLIYESYTGYNSLGFISYMPGRLAGFFKDELVVGGYLSAFSLIILAFIHNNLKNKNLSILFFLLVIFISFIIGERSNFIKTVIILTIFFSAVSNLNIKIKILTLIFIPIALLTILTSDICKGNKPCNSYNIRFIGQTSEIFKKDGIKKYLKKSTYGAHYNTAKEIFKDNLIFGVGIKNFRVESSKKKYENKDYELTELRWGTHPHQIHYELLSETGLVGYVSFLIFLMSSVYLAIINYLKYRNFYQLSGILFVLISALPLLPSGSFFSTFSSSLFWMNYALMVGYIKR